MHYNYCARGPCTEGWRTVGLHIEATVRGASAGAIEDRCLVRVLLPRRYGRNRCNSRAHMARLSLVRGGLETVTAKCIRLVLNRRLDVLGFIIGAFPQTLITE